MNRGSFTLQTLACLALLPTLTGCGTTDRIKLSSVPLDDYKERHPIVLAQARTSIDLFPSGGQHGLDRHTAKQVFAFAQDYRTVGHGPVLVLLPRGRNVAESHAMLAEIRRNLAAGGARSGVEVATYPVADARLAAPVRLSFEGLKAAVADQCGQWPRDLASGSTVDEWDNKPYWNLGCATQSMIAAQTSDPRDLVTPRGEETTDVLIRSRGIESIRKGSDPATGWQVKSSSIGTVGGG